MQKATKWFLLSGMICMSFAVFTRDFFQTPESITDFLKGFGLVLVFAALVHKVRDRRDKGMEHMRGNEQ